MGVAAGVHHAAQYDALFVGVSVALSVVGSFAAVVSALRIPVSEGPDRLRWTAAAAVSLGGGAIWAMHFMGMAAYHVAGVDISYDILLTALSFVIAVGVSGLGLIIVGRDPRSVSRLTLGGFVAGLGVAAMHYTGMAAMRMGATVTYDPTLVGVSVVIAVFAALAALWILFRVQSKIHIFVASLVMALAVCGMHYTGMAATRMVATNDISDVSRGVDPVTLSLAVCVLTFSILAVVIFSALGGVSEIDIFSLAAARPASASASASGPGPAASPMSNVAWDPAPHARRATVQPEEVERSGQGRERGDRDQSRNPDRQGHRRARGTQPVSAREEPPVTANPRGRSYGR